MRIKTKKNFRKEFKRQVKYAVAAAVGLMIAYAWKETIFQSTQDIVQKFTETTKVITTNFGTSVVITLVGVLIILISSKLLKD